MSDFPVTPKMADYIRYHAESEKLGDIDPGYPLLRYVCDRFDLNLEQRFWLAWLYGATYCAPTVFYIYSEFQDYENVDVGRLGRWWNANRPRVVFQSDRQWIRSRNQFVDMFVSYRDAVGPSQVSRFGQILQLGGGNPQLTYRIAYDHFRKCYQMGRFGLFLFLEAVHVVTEFPMRPDKIEWEDAQSSRNGLCFACDRHDLLRGHEYGDDPFPKWALPMLDQSLDWVEGKIAKTAPNVRADHWNVETSLCAYKKFKRAKRYPGYYIDRQYDEIFKMEARVPEGVCWQVLWDFRDETWVDNMLLERSTGANESYWQKRFAAWKLAGQEPVFDEAACADWRMAILGDGK